MKIVCFDKQSLKGSDRLQVVKIARGGKDLEAGLDEDYLIDLAESGKSEVGIRILFRAEEVEAIQGLWFLHEVEYNE